MPEIAEVLQEINDKLVLLTAMNNRLEEIEKKLIGADRSREEVRDSVSLTMALSGSSVDDILSSIQQRNRDLKKKNS